MIFTVSFEEAKTLISKQCGLPSGTKVVISRPRKNPSRVDPAPIEILSLTQRQHKAVVGEVDRLLAEDKRVEAIKTIRTHNGMALKTALAVIDNWSTIREKILAAGRFLDPVFTDKYDETPSKWV